MRKRRRSVPLTLVLTFGGLAAGCQLLTGLSSLETTEGAGAAPGAGGENTGGDSDGGDSDGGDSVGGAGGQGAAPMGGTGGMPMPPATPSPLTPINHAHIGSVHQITPIQAQFSWTDVSAGMQMPLDYRVTYGTDPALMGGDSQQIITTATSLPATLSVQSLTKPLGSKFYWQVRACHAAMALCSPPSPLRWFFAGRPRHDVNGDGIDDVMVGATLQPDPSPTVYDDGAVQIYFGAPGLTDKGPDQTFYGPELYRLGESVAVADLNGDGYGDVIAGSATGLNSYGYVQVYLGSSGGLTNGFKPVSPTNEQDTFFGVSVTNAGDLNGDGFADVAVGRPGQGIENNQPGRVYIYFGTDNFSASTAAATPLQGSIGEDFGRLLEGAGDINGDGLDDLLVSAAGSTGAGQVRIYFGDANMGTTPGPNLAVSGSGDFGSTMAMLGDVNGDGIGDFAITDGADPDDTVYVYFGGATVDTTAALTITGSNMFGELPLVVGAAGDVNRDGYADIAVMNDESVNVAPGARVRLYFGGPNGPDSVADAEMVFGDGNGPSVWGPYMGKPGDFNGDGFVDLPLGPRTDDTRPVIFLGTSTNVYAAPVTLNGPNVGFTRGIY